MPPQAAARAAARVSIIPERAYRAFFEDLRSGGCDAQPQIHAKMTATGDEAAARGWAVGKCRAVPRRMYK